MSSSPTAPISTTGSSTTCASRAERVALVACGALAQHAEQIVEAQGWPVDVHPLPPLLHNQPQLIAGQVEATARELRGDYLAVAVGYADCGTYGALDEVCRRLGLRRLPGLHCYDVYGGAERLRAFFDEQPGTYVLTDFLVRSFARTVLRELGLDRYPDLRDAYFGNYTRIVWLAQEPDDQLCALADQAAARIGLPLTVVHTGTAALRTALRELLPTREAATSAPACDLSRATQAVFSPLNGARRASQP